jgi:AcrR family transcriptional regulator
MARRREPDTRQRILSVVSRLFGQYGIRAVGIQHVVDVAGTGKNLLYREFASKEDLIVAWLKEGRTSWRNSFDATIREHADDAARQLLAVVEAVHADMRAPDYRGCMFQNTCTEFPDPVHPAHRESCDHLQEVRGKLESLATKAGADDPAALADSLMLLISGMHASGAVLGVDGPARMGMPITEALIRLHCPDFNEQEL